MMDGISFPFAKGILEQTLAEIVAPEGIGCLLNRGGKTTTKTPWFRDEVEAGLEGKKFLLDLAEKVEPEELGEVEAEAVEVEGFDEVLETIDNEATRGGRVGPAAGDRLSRHRRDVSRSRLEGEVRQHSAGR